MKVYDNGDVLALILTSGANDNVAFTIYLLLPWKKRPIIPWKFGWNVSTGKRASCLPTRWSTRVVVRIKSSMTPGDRRTAWRCWFDNSLWAERPGVCTSVDAWLSRHIQRGPPSLLSNGNRNGVYHPPLLASVSSVCRVYLHSVPARHSPYFFYPAIFVALAGTSRSADICWYATSLTFWRWSYSFNFCTPRI